MFANVYLGNLGKAQNNTKCINLLYTGNPWTGSFANSEDPDEMQHNAEFHQALDCLLRLKTTFEDRLHHNLENSTCDP